MVSHSTSVGRRDTHMVGRRHTLVWRGETLTLCHTHKVWRGETLTLSLILTL